MVSTCKVPISNRLRMRAYQQILVTGLLIIQMSNIQVLLPLCYGIDGYYCFHKSIVNHISFFNKELQDFNNIVKLIFFSYNSFQIVDGMD